MLFVERKHIKIRNIDVGSTRGCVGREPSTGMQLSKYNWQRTPVCPQASSNIFTNYIAGEILAVTHLNLN